MKQFLNTATKKLTWNGQSKKSLNKSSKGEPGGTWKSGMLEYLSSIICVVEILTTLGISSVTKSEKLSGNSLEFVDKLNKNKNKIKWKKMYISFFNLNIF